MLINCVAYEGGKKLADIQPSDIHNYVCKPECFVWVALFEPTREELDAMHRELNVGEVDVFVGRN
jgi:magnesium transporter